MTLHYDEHQTCRDEIEFWRERAKDAGAKRIQQVVLQTTDGVGTTATNRLTVLKILRVDAFQDGLRILVEQ